MAYTKNVREIVEQIRVADEDELNSLEKEYANDPRVGLQKALSTARKRIAKQKAEHERVDKMYQIMREYGDDKIVVGVDEVGRGSLAGPLTVGAVVLPNYPIIEGLNDSKQLSPKQREELAASIEQHARAIGIAHIQPKTIDEKGIIASLRMAMDQAIEKLDLDPDVVLIDGNPIYAHPKEKCIVKGDAKVACIAAASIVAKVTRDNLMVELDKKYPGYHLAQSKGYGSPQHIQAIREMGLTEIHRESYCEGLMQETLF